MANNESKEMKKIEEDYWHKKDELENKIADLEAEKRSFARYLDQLGEKIPLTQRIFSDGGNIDPRIAYRLINDASEEGQYLVRKALHRIEDELAENQQNYQSAKLNHKNQ
ncbi:MULTISPECIES: hypothetical protein [Enterococcus]|uniref:Uncharacterized protein n=1 Tax=Enterococcus mundtii TaxID=53346 RepID=A0A242KZ06_ENTMU|nr:MULTISPECIES: hypothetical protein [Enterococcus]MDB7087561.1 hypothetical protein [Enterococcus mundtii]NBA62198.1 hypothetical protein [Enterococcus mundtii]OTP27101.1 hypothetical protein A5802_000836 [Enterococcus mundtii]